MSIFLRFPKNIYINSIEKNIKFLTKMIRNQEYKNKHFFLKNALSLCVPGQLNNPKFYIQNFVSKNVFIYHELHKLLLNCDFIYKISIFGQNFFGKILHFLHNLFG